MTTRPNSLLGTPVVFDMVGSAKSKNLVGIIVVWMVILAWIFTSGNATWSSRYFPSSLIDICFASAICLFLFFFGQSGIWRPMLSHVGVVTGFAIALLWSAPWISALTQSSAFSFQNVCHGTVEHYAMKGFGLCG